MVEGTKTIKASDLPSGSMKTVRVDSEDVLLVNLDGKYFGIGGICTHEMWELSEGILEGTRVTCAGHGAVWDLETGKSEFDEELPPEPLYDVVEEGGYLYVSRRP